MASGERTKELQQYCINRQQGKAEMRGMPNASLLLVILPFLSYSSNVSFQASFCVYHGIGYYTKLLSARLARLFSTLVIQVPGAIRVIFSRCKKLCICTYQVQKKLLIGQSDKHGVIVTNLEVHRVQLSRRRPDSGTRSEVQSAPSVGPRCDKKLQYFELSPVGMRACHNVRN